VRQEIHTPLSGLNRGCLCWGEKKDTLGEGRNDRGGEWGYHQTVMGYKKIIRADSGLRVSRHSKGNVEGISKRGEKSRGDEERTEENSRSDERRQHRGVRVSRVGHPSIGRSVDEPRKKIGRTWFKLEVDKTLGDCSGRVGRGHGGVRETGS